MEGRRFADTGKEILVRPQSEIKVTVRQTVIGGPRPCICLPLVASDRSSLCGQTDALLPLAPDLFEWRADGYAGVNDAGDCLDTLAALRAAIGDIPLIFTCRMAAEGGLQPLTPEIRLDRATEAIRSGLVDIVDVELANDAAFIDAVAAAARRHGIRLILSHHDFTATPAADVILEKLAAAQQKGADIAKAAFMPAGYRDVLTLLTATLAARSGIIRIPMITIAMGDEGRFSRLAGGLFGADITFAAGTAASAPGQLPIGELRRAMDALYGG